MTRFWCEPGKPAQMATLIQASGQFRHGEEIRGPPNVQVRHEWLAAPGNNQPDDGSRFRGRGLIAIMPLLLWTPLWATTASRIQQAGWSSMQCCH